MASVVIPKINEYGAREIKEFIRRATYRAFAYTGIGFVVLIIAYFLSGAIAEATKRPPLVAPIVKLDLIELPPQDAAVDVPPPPPPQTIINTGPAARAGTPVPVPDADIAPDLQEFASMDIMDRASAEGGEGLDLGDFSNNIDFDNQGINVGVREEEPDPDEFIVVEVEPGVDYAKLQSLVEYPSIAQRAGIQGQVVVKVLVGKQGEIRKKMIEYSDNPMLDKAALDAIDKYGNFTPAIQNKEPVMVWVSVPIRFKLK